jgi:hypothetical protein
MGFMVLVKIKSVLNNILLQNTKKSAQIVLVMSDRTDEFHELWKIFISNSIAINFENND